VTLDLAASLAGLPPPDAAAAAAVTERARRVLRPAGAFARLDEVAAWVAGWQRREDPGVERPACVVFVGDHGVTARGVSAYPGAITAAMLGAMRAGVATASVLSRQLGANLVVVDVGVGRPTSDLSVQAALSAERFEAAFQAGRDAVASLDADLLVIGEMGIGNTTAAAATCAALFGRTAEDWTGRGTGVDEPTYARKVAAVRRAVDRVRDLTPVEIMREVGGSELAAMAGATLEARLRSLPILLDGFVVTAAVAPLDVIAPGALDHCLAAHVSSEPGHRLLLEKLGKQPLLDLDLRLGEGSGALMALPLIGLACAAVTDVATFEEWGI
jgi:nicotinate-nucleotide--dimethylbenzimidazole phosphoribosyltransferase